MHPVEMTLSHYRDPVVHDKNTNASYYKTSETNSSHVKVLFYYIQVNQNQVHYTQISTEVSPYIQVTEKNNKYGKQVWKKLHRNNTWIAL